MPRLIWASEDEDGRTKVVDSTFEKIEAVGGESRSFTKNTLTIKKLSRKHFGMTFTCFASNNNATEAAASNVTIDMKRKMFCRQFSSQNQLPVRGSMHEF